MRVLQRSDVTAAIVALSIPLSALAACDPETPPGGTGGTSGDAGVSPDGAGQGGLGSGGSAGASVGEDGSVDDAESGTGAVGTGGIGGVAGSAGVAGAAGASLLDGAPDGNAASVYCGDAIRDPVLEECDDGPGTSEDACMDTCQAHNYFVVPPLLIDGGPKQGLRTLGRGRHPVDGGVSGSAVAFIEKTGSTHSLQVAFFDEFGARLGPPIMAGVGALASEQPEPVVAALPGGSFAFAWNDLAGGSLDIALRLIAPGSAPSPLVLANQTIAGAQRDADLLWTGTELVAAWTDGVQPKVRRFDANLLALDSESSLATAGTVAGSVSLAGFGSSWAAAWRVINPSGLESIQVRAGTTIWSVGPFVPGASLDRPALIALDSAHLLLVYTEGTDPLGSGTSSTTRLRGAVLDTANPVASIFSISATLEPWASDATLPESRPGLARSGSRMYLTWQAESPVSNVLNDEVWLREVTWNGGVLALLPEASLQADASRVEAQRAPAIAGSPLGPHGALLTLWEDALSDPTHAFMPDLVFGLRPTPIVKLLNADGGSQ